MCRTRCYTRYTVAFCRLHFFRAPRVWTCASRSKDFGVSHTCSHLRRPPNNSTQKMPYDARLRDTTLFRRRSRGSALSAVTDPAGHGPEKYGGCQVCALWSHDHKCAHIGKEKARILRPLALSSPSNIQYYTTSSNFIILCKLNRVSLCIQISTQYY